MSEQYRFTADRRLWCQPGELFKVAATCRRYVCVGCTAGRQDAEKYGARTKGVVQRPHYPGLVDGGVLSNKTGEFQKVTYEQELEHRSTDTSTTGTLNRAFRRLAKDGHAKSKRKHRRK